MPRAATATLIAALILAAGCGDSGEGTATPAACLAGPRAYLEALEAAPGEVRLGGTTAISDCLVSDQETGALARVGESIVGAATELNRELRRDFDRERAERLGYLVGAVQEGASGTGLHSDLVIRLDAAARFAGGEGAFPARFERAFNAGYAAGQERG